VVSRIDAVNRTQGVQVRQRVFSDHRWRTLNPSAWMNLPPMSAVGASPRRVAAKDAAASELDLAPTSRFRQVPTWQAVNDCAHVRRPTFGTFRATLLPLFGSYSHLLENSSRLGRPQRRARVSLKHRHKIIPLVGRHEAALAIRTSAQIKSPVRIWLTTPERNVYRCAAEAVARVSILSKFLLVTLRMILVAPPPDSQ
jgi:hypothetical protein